MHEPAPLIYLVAGEHSGDILGARLIAALRRIRPDLAFRGVGGPRMQAEGCSSVFAMDELAVMGLVEVLPRVLRLRRLMRDVEADIRARRPAILVTIDSPGFNLRMLQRLRDIGLPRIHYVGPQVWAWRQNRVHAYPGLWDQLLCLLPFEPEFFARFDLPARFVGHPVLESGADCGDGARFRARYGIAADAPVLVLMPGSRRSEVARLLPVFGATLRLLRDRIAGLVPVVPVASAVAGAVRSAAAAWPVAPVVVTELDDKHDAYAAASAALTKSGTSTLELALAGVPMAVTYRLSPMTALVARRLIRVPHVAMVNLLARAAVVPELLQEDCTPSRLADAVVALVGDHAAAQAQRLAFTRIVASLRPTDAAPSEAAAAAVLALLPVAITGSTG